MYSYYLCADKFYVLNDLNSLFYVDLFDDSNYFRRR
jgi:hypothetical protein